MSLQTILAKSDYNGMNASQIRTALDTDVVGSGDSTAYTWSGLGQKLLENGVSSAVVLALPTTIPALNGGPLFDKCLSSGGFDFSDATNRALMTAAKSGASSDEQSLIDSMLSIGADKKKWEVEELDALPTETEIENELFAKTCDLIASRLRAGQIDTVASAKEALAAG